MSIQTDPSAHGPRPRASDSPSGGSPFEWAAVLRPLGALLCLGGATLMMLTSLGQKAPPV